MRFLVKLERQRFEEATVVVEADSQTEAHIKAMDLKVDFTLQHVHTHVSRIEQQRLADDIRIGTRFKE